MYYFKCVWGQICAGCSGMRALPPPAQPQLQPFLVDSCDACLPLKALESGQRYVSFCHSADFWNRFLFTPSAGPQVSHYIFPVGFGFLFQLSRSFQNLLLLPSWLAILPNLVLGKACWIFKFDQQVFLCLDLSPW